VNVLHSFTGPEDGFSPIGGLTETVDGALIGATSLGGPGGTGLIYTLMPPPQPSGTPTPTPSASPTPVPSVSRTATPTASPTATSTATATARVTPAPSHSATPSPSASPSPKPTPVTCGNPIIKSLAPTPVLVGSSFIISGSCFTVGSVVNFFISTSNGPINPGPFTPSASSLPTQLTVDVPATTPLGQGFVEVQVVNTDKGFAQSNSFPALLQGFAAAGIPSLSSINGVGLAATSSDPSFATDNVETVVPQGSVVKLGGDGFDTVNGVAVDLFCACPGGKVGPFFLNPGGPGLSSTR